MVKEAGRIANSLDYLWDGEVRHRTDPWTRPPLTRKAPTADVSDVPFRLFLDVDGAPPGHASWYVVRDPPHDRVAVKAAFLKEVPWLCSHGLVPLTDYPVSMAQAIARATFNRFDGNSDGFLSSHVRAGGDASRCYVVTRSWVRCGRSSHPCAGLPLGWRSTWTIFGAACGVRLGCPRRGAMGVCLT